YAARLTLVLHAVAAVSPEGLPEEVPAARVKAAWQLVDYFKGHAARVYGALERDEDTARAELLLRWLRREGRTRFRPWQAYKDLKGHRLFARPEDLERLVERLCRYEYLRPCPVTQPAPRRPRREYDVNPHALEGPSPAAG